MTTLSLVLVVLLCCGTLAGAQPPNDSTDLEKYFVFDNPSPFSCLFTLFPTILLQHEVELKAFISSETFVRIREHYGDLKAVDAIFVRAMQLTDNNTGASLLISSLATFEHDMAGIKNPVFAFFLPLTSETDAAFHERVQHLPRLLYPDSPTDESGDNDKLQHFFGSAFLSFVFESDQTSERFGMFVEKGERLMIYQGTYDDRDLRADAQGAFFGAALLKNNHSLPSSFFEAGRGALESEPEPADESFEMDFEVR